MSKAAASSPSGWLNRKTLVYITVAVVVIAVGLAIHFANTGAISNAAQTVNPDATKIKVGSTAPTFSITSNAGPFDLASVNTPVFLEVFASWCPHCQHEVPIVDALAKQYAGRVAFIGVSGSPYGIDGSSPENQADINEWVQNLPDCLRSRSEDRQRVSPGRLPDDRDDRQQQGRAVRQQR
jgi:thiol-disulfide isomerase/thioredoxin